MSRKRPSSPNAAPILSLRLENFRLFQDSDWFRLAPLTCLVGRNSSGKSSLVNALLLLKQSMEQESVSPTIAPLTLNGPYCELGNFIDLVHNHDEQSKIVISLSLPFVTSGEREFFPPFVTLRVPRTHGAGSYYYPRYFERRPTTGRIEARLSFGSDEPFGPSLSELEVSVENVGTCRFRRTVSGERRQHWRMYTLDLPPKSIGLRSHPRSFFPFLQLRDRSYSVASPRTKGRIRTFVGALQYLFEHVSRLMARCEVVGPFRTPPSRQYGFAGFSTTKSGTSGERAVDLLITEFLLKAESSQALRSAVSFWLKHLKLASSLDVREIAKKLKLFELSISGAATKVDASLADVGFGISQVLPVIVQGLLMRPGGIYLVQQPEIHLHPDAQAGLADFFIWLASYGVTTVVETHSEYLLIRLRRRMAEGIRPLKTGLAVESNQRWIPISPSDVSVLLTGMYSGEPSVTELKIGDGFQFDNLPKDFMSQAMEDRVALLAALNKNAR